VVGTMCWTNALTGSNGTFSASSPWEIADIKLALDSNTITVNGSNVLGTVCSDSVIITRSHEHGPGSPFHYVATNGANVWPYTNWNDAAVIIQDAVDAASDSDTVLVSNGVYSTGGEITPGFAISNRVFVSKSIIIKSVSGAKKSIISGKGSLSSNAVRCVYLTNGASLVGFTLSNGYTFSSGDYDFEQGGGGAFLHNGGIISNCIITDCEAQRFGGGVYCYYGGKILGSELKNNIVHREGAGARLLYGGEINRCHIHDNLADNWDGGGVYVYYNGLIANSLIEKNEGYSGAGVYLCNNSGAGPRLYNCTVVNNTSDWDGGGVRCLNGGVVRNCIIYNNTAGTSGNNYENMGPSISYQNTCITPAISGTGNIDTAPGFFSIAEGNYRLLYTSLCVNSGNNSFAIGDKDLDGISRIANGTIDMGCFEFSSVQYVSTNGAHIFPFSTWPNAATNIQDAVDAAAPGNLVLVSNGTYLITDDIDITNDLTVKAVSENPELTIIDANNTTRAFQLSDFNITIFGFTLTNGNVGSSNSGGGVYCSGTKPVISNCVLSSCYANFGAAAQRGTLYNCKIYNNETLNYGTTRESVLYFCEVYENEAGSGGGISDGTAHNCNFHNNEAKNWGGCAHQSTLYNCSISRNSANIGGGTYESKVNNCTIVNNTAAGGGGTRNSIVSNSIIYYNYSYQNSNKFGGTYNYCCTTPEATNGIGNISAKPMLVNAFHITTNSPCIGAGSTDSISGVDIDGEIWKIPPSIGCDEVYANSISGSLSVAISSDKTYTYIDIPITFSADIDGKAFQYIWNFDDGIAETNKFQVNHSWSDLGEKTAPLTQL